MVSKRMLDRLHERLAEASVKRCTALFDDQFAHYDRESKQFRRLIDLALAGATDREIEAAVVDELPEVTIRRMRDGGRP